MLSYILRRLAYAIPILLGVNIITFILFFVVNPPADQARTALGGKNVTPAMITRYLQEKGYNKPRFYNSAENGLEKITQTIFYQKFIALLWFDFGRADTDKEPIGRAIKERMIPSLSLTVPSLLLGLSISIGLAMLVAFYRGTYLDIWGVVICVFLMSISILYYVIGLQYFIGQSWRLIPVSGWGEGLDNWRFALGPIVISVVGGIGGSVRFYRTMFLEELSKDYIRTARSKGLSEIRVLYGHGLRNAMIPILTSVVAALPFLIIGSLVLENFFAIPGLGNYTVGALQAKDFAVVRSMVYLGSILYIGGLILTDISYALVDPRISFSGNSGSGSRIWTIYLGVIIFIGLIICLGHFTDPGTIEMQTKQKQITATISAPPALTAGAKKSEQDFWRSFDIYAANIITLIVVLTVLLTLYLAAQHEYWCNAWRQVKNNRLAVVSLILVLLYTTIALLDSLAWRDQVLGPERKPIINKLTNKPELERKSKSMLDRLWVLSWRYFATAKATDHSWISPQINKVSDTWETTYSAPMAKVHLQKMMNPDSGKREYPPLRYKRMHLLGTDEAGVDTLYRCLKGIRTGLIIGLITTLIALPFAILFGILAGYKGGWIDDLIQYIYTTLSSIPGVLLIMSFILIFGQGLWQVCLILGITGWVGLCRLLRGETLKLREMEYVEAAKTMGISDCKIMLKHILPNLMHIVLINLVLSFSGLVLAEATLTYIGIGVGGETGSWGNMINAARMELARDPAIWWSLAGSFFFMLMLILPVNLLADVVRDALDPRLRTGK